MTATTTKSSLLKRRMARKVAVTAIAAVGFVGVSATAAQADSTILSPQNYRTSAEAQTSLPALRKQCTDKGGNVIKAEVHQQDVGGVTIYYGYVLCSK